MLSEKYVINEIINNLKTPELVQIQFKDDELDIDITSYGFIYGIEKDEKKKNLLFDKRLNLYSNGLSTSGFRKYQMTNKCKIPFNNITDIKVCKLTKAYSLSPDSLDIAVNEFLGKIICLVDEKDIIKSIHPSNNLLHIFRVDQITVSFAEKDDPIIINGFYKVVNDYTYYIIQ